MGHELWYSTKTGHRRRGTRFSEIRDLLGSGLTIRSISEDLLSCSADIPAAEAVALLEQREFDVAGVVEAKGEPPIGWVAAVDLKSGLVRNHLRAFEAGQILSESTPFRVALHAFQSEERFFVLEGREVRAIITSSDLNKPPVRAWLFSLVSLVELHLDYWISKDYPENQWEDAIAPPRLAAAARIRGLRNTVARSDVSLRDCLQFCDKRDLAIKSQAMRDRFTWAQREKAAEQLKLVERLRDEIAHAAPKIGLATSWSSIGAQLEWAEDFLLRSDRLVEAQNEANSSQ